MDDKLCKKCNVVAIESKALLNRVYYSDDFGGNDKSLEGKTGNLDKTEAKLVDCLKCPNCGKCWIPSNVK